MTLRFLWAAAAKPNSGARGPTLLENFLLREKIFHFYHERIPERNVHARGSGAYGCFSMHQRYPRTVSRVDLCQKRRQSAGVPTFRSVNAKSGATFLKFHWKPSRGVQSTTWDEVVEISGADPAFLRRDLHDGISNGDLRAWQLGIQIFDEKLLIVCPMIFWMRPR